MSYTENRVTTKEFGSLPSDSPLLVNVPTAPGHSQQRLHVLAADKFTKMSATVESDLKFSLLAASGWRPHRWTSREQYEQVLIAKYGSVARGKLFLAFDSPHETGLACDFGCGGLMPISKTIAAQKQTPLFAWLREHAWEYGFTPYMVEPWHWEIRLSLPSFQSGQPDPPPVADPTPPVCDPDDPNCIEAPLDPANSQS
jgi:hypothetical protein